MNRGPSLKLDRSQAVGYYKIMKGINYVNLRSKQNNRRAVEAVEDAWTGLQPASCCMYHRRQVGQDTGQRLRWLLCIEGPVQVQDRARRSAAKVASYHRSKMGRSNGNIAQAA